MSKALNAHVNVLRMKAMIFHAVIGYALKTPDVFFGDTPQE